MHPLGETADRRSHTNYDEYNAWQANQATTYPSRGTVGSCEPGATVTAEDGSAENQDGHGVPHWGLSMAPTNFHLQNCRGLARRRSWLRRLSGTQKGSFEEGSEQYNPQF